MKFRCERKDFQRPARKAGLIAATPVVKFDNPQKFQGFTEGTVYYI